MNKETIFPLVRDSKGKKSWTLTFCVLALPLIIVTVVAYFILDGKGPNYANLVSLTKSYSQITIGAFIVREVTEKIKGSIAEKFKGTPRQ